MPTSSRLHEGRSVAFGRAIAPISSPSAPAWMAERNSCMGCEVSKCRGPGIGAIAGWTTNRSGWTGSVGSGRRRGRTSGLWWEGLGWSAPWDGLGSAAQRVSGSAPGEVWMEVEGGFPHQLPCQPAAGRGVRRGRVVVGAARPYHGAVVVAGPWGIAA